MAQLPSEYFTLTCSQRGAMKLVERGYIHGKQRSIGEVTHWLCKAIIHTKGAEIIKRTNVHLNAPDEQTTVCCEVKAGIKRKAVDSQDTSHQIVGESLQTVSERVAAKLPKLDSLKRSIQR